MGKLGRGVGEGETGGGMEIRRGGERNGDRKENVRRVGRGEGEQVEGGGGREGGGERERERERERESKGDMTRVSITITTVPSSRGM